MSVTVDGMQPALDRIDRIADAGRDGTALMRLLADDYAEAEGNLFASLHWTLTPEYLATKAKRHPGQPIGVASGRLRSSLTSRPMAVEIVTPTGVTLGTNVPYVRKRMVLPYSAVQQAWRARLDAYAKGATR